MTQTNLSENGAIWEDNASYSDWKRLYQAALLEVDAAKIRARIADAQIAILKRATELVARSACREHQELDDALRFLRLLENEASSEREVA